MLKKNQKGFSIIELIVVVAIICLISAISYPNIMKWYTKKQLRNDAHKVFAVLKDIQQESILNKQLYRVKISPEGPITTISVMIGTNPDCADKSSYQNNENRLNLENSKLYLENSKLLASGYFQVFSPNGCCSKDQEYTKEIEIIHKDDKNNGDDYGKYKITTKKATCFINLKKD